MKKLFTLVLMQLKEKRMRVGLKKEVMFNIIFAVMAFAAITALAYLFFYICVRFNILSPTTKLPLTALIFIFTVLQLLSIITVTAGLTRALYFSGDNQILLTLPVAPNIVFLSKLIIFYINEVKKNALFVLPVFTAFGIINGYSPWFYVVTLFSFFFVSLLPVALSSVLSIPMCYIVLFVRNYKWLQLSLAAIAAAALITVFFLFSASIPANLDLIGQWGAYCRKVQNFLTNFKNIFLPFAWLTEMIAGKDLFFKHIALPAQFWVYFSGLLGAITVLSGTAFFAARPLYFKMVSKPFEHKSRAGKTRQNKKAGHFWSMMKKELILNLRSPAQFFANTILLFILPLAIFLLNRIFAAMNTRLRGDYMALSFNVLIMLLILLVSNVYMASVFSSEGKAIYILKTKPETVWANISAKLVFNLVLSALSIILTVILMASGNQSKTAAAPPYAFALIFFIAFAVNAAHVFWSVQMDITNPQYSNYVNDAHTGTNPNEIKSAIAAVVLSLAFFGTTLFLLMENYAQAWWKVAAIAAAFLGARIYLLWANAKVYFKEM